MQYGVRNRRGLAYLAFDHLPSTSSDKFQKGLNANHKRAISVPDPDMVSGMANILENNNCVLELPPTVLLWVQCLFVAVEVARVIALQVLRCMSQRKIRRARRALEAQMIRSRTVTFSS